MTDVYARYTRLRFDRPHPKVLRIAMDNGKMKQRRQRDACRTGRYLARR